ncbi:MAG TPA: tyrosine/phenylalanine carboxypeptidase domain-containing protein [Candidatus Bipolaricaulota bacterium]|nr:tyrosine/phenylalanine carboxypeptidase domain-containing protein [Candidatus Bipolaricaulota bacterium]
MQNFEKPKAIDEQWYDTFEKHAAFQAYEYMDGDKEYREEQKKKFIAGEMENPELDYPKIDVKKIEETEQILLKLRKDIKTLEENEIVSQLYRWRLNEKIAELRILKAAANKDMHRFQGYSEFVYGAPSPDIFAYTVQNVRKTAEKAVESDNADVKKTAQELLSALPDKMPEVKIQELPDEPTVQLAKEMTEKEMSDLINISYKDGNFNAEDITAIFTQALAGLRADGWQVAIDKSSKTAISVDQELKTIKIPESRKMLFNKLRTLIAHEIGTHVARRTNGERSRLKLLGLGLDRYEKGEEGVATMREQALSEELNDFAGLDGHLAIGLACGLDDQPRDFRKVYEILEKYYRLNNLLRGKKMEEAVSASTTIAWNRAIRTFRGTDCKTPGVCFTKDIIYREGNIETWNVVKNKPEEMSRFSIGKYDPANPRHIWILDTLGITDKELNQAQQTS